MDLISQYNERLRQRYLAVARRGVRKFDFLGGRRSGKSYLIEQILLGRMLRGEVVNVASMTSEQGRLGVYADTCDIIDGSPTMQPWVEVLKSPRQINCKANRGRMFFNSYPDPERAKGIACDWLYINEANNFTEQQYIDLSASVRKGIFCDRNPNSECWTERNDFVMIHSTWRDNDYLTDQQREWFETLRRKAESATATPTDVALYKRYYLGEYAEIGGEVFTISNIQRIDELPACGHYLIFCDPSALRGNDYFACVLTATDGATMYVVDAISLNNGGQSGRVDIVRQLRKWQCSYDVEHTYVETNGEIGISFYEFAENSGLQVEPWVSRGNKYDRIMTNYMELTGNVQFYGFEQRESFLQQIYDFGERCEHDDNLDAVNSAYLAHKWNGSIAIAGI